MLPPFKNVLEFTIYHRLNLCINWKGFLHSQSSKESRRGPGEEKHKTNFPESPPLNSFVKPETFWDGLGWQLTAHRFLSLDMVLYVFFSSSLLPGVAERWAAANKISPHVISDLQTQPCRLPTSLQKTPIPGSACSQQWQKPNRISRNMW